MAVTAEQTQLSLIKEAIHGETPANPAFDVVNVVSESVAPEPTFTESEMITGGTRGIPDNVLTQLSVGGDLNRELVFEVTTELLFESLLGNEWGVDPIGNTTTADQLYDFTTLISATYEKRFLMDPAPTYNFHTYTGLVAATGTIDFAPGAIITQNTTLIGLGMTTYTVPLSGATYTQPVGNSPMTAPRVTSINITEAGTKTPVAWMSDACFSQLTITIENNTRALACIGQLENSSVALGRINVQGSGELYFNSSIPIESLLNETEYGLIVVAEDLDLNSYEFFMPRVKFTAVTDNVTGQSTDIMTTFTVQALQEPTLQYTIILTRATTPPAPLTAGTANGLGTTEVTIQLGGGPSDTTTSADLAIAVTGDTTLTPNPVALPEGRTLMEFGDDVAAEFNRINVDLNATHNGAGLVTLSAGGLITSIDTCSVTVN